MFPCFPMNNMFNSCSANIEHDANLFLGPAMRMKFPNLDNLIVIKFGIRAIHSTLIPMSSVSSFIKCIFTTRSPAQVVKMVIQRIAIKVAALHLWRRWADKGEQNQCVDANGDVLTQTYPAIINQFSSLGRIVQRPCEDSLGGVYYGYHSGTHNFYIRPYTALIGNIISREAWNWFENLWGCGRILVSHGVALLNRVASGLEPYLCDNRGAACSFIAT